MAMHPIEAKLMSTTVFPLIAGTGVMIGVAVVAPPPVNAAGLSTRVETPLPAAKPRPGIHRVACNPCAAKNPCNPCAAANPCNPCAAGGGSASSKCFVPRLAAANPCAAKNPCNPCAAANPCGPCNPCNPCGAGGGDVELTAQEAETGYECLHGEMAADYAKAGVAEVKGYQDWFNAAMHPYVSATHGGRYVNNYANAKAAAAYAKFEDVGTMPAGSVLAKDSFVANANGTLSVGPLFVMEKMPAGFDAGTHDWRYTMIMPNGSVFGTTGGANASRVGFCAECHASMADVQDSLFFLPDEFRVKP